MREKGKRKSPVLLTSVFSVGATVKEKQITASVNATKSKRLYLAHPFLDQEKGLELQKKLESLGFEVLNPFISVENKAADQILSKDELYTYEFTGKLVNGDLKEIEKSDGLVALVTKKASIGTHMEVFYASRILRMPVFALYDFVFEGRNVHPWYMYLTKYFLNEEGLFAALTKWRDE